MKVKIPKVDSNEGFGVIDNKSSIVLIGANGSGKTRMSVWIEQNNENVFRISAQKSLVMPENVSPKDLEIAQNELYYGNKNPELGKQWTTEHYRWGEKPNTAMLNDFNKLLTYLVSEDYEKSIEYRKKHKEGQNNFDNETILDNVKRVWEDIVKHRKLEITPGKINVLTSDGSSYNGADMSDGEREIFYFLGEVLSAPSQSIIVIDEPENHLHDLILNDLWDKLEQIRSDCTFIYITHKIDFAVSRNNSTILWLKDYKGNNIWDYLIVAENQIPYDLFLTILGSRKKVLLVEGNYDYRLYSLIFSDYNVIKIGSCENIITYVKCFTELENIHYMSVNGIIDRDQRTESILEEYKKAGIYSLKFNEIENLFLIPEIIEYVSKNFGKTDEEIEKIINSVKNKVFDKIIEQKNLQLLKYVKYEVKNKQSEVLNKKNNDINDFKNYYAENNLDSNKIQDIYDSYECKMNDIISSRDYNKILEFYSNKGLIDDSGVLKALGISREAYVDIFINGIKINQFDDGIIKQYINFD
ncbi:MAG: AAA family ATPase [Clostridia bacterium]|nr:AAA family ATPase [Clostridia bacterium]